MSAQSNDGGPRWLVIGGGLAALLASVATILGVLISTGVISNPFNASATKGFAGAWEATDTADQSHLTLTISSTYHVIYNDDLASICSGRPMQAMGSGQVSGNELTVVLTRVCRQPQESRGTVTIVYTYNLGKDTLSDGAGNLWIRTG